MLLKDSDEEVRREMTLMLMRLGSVTKKMQEKMSITHCHSVKSPLQPTKEYRSSSSALMTKEKHSKTETRISETLSFTVIENLVNEKVFNEEGKLLERNQSFV